MPIFCEPYSIIFQEDSLDYFSLKEGDLLKLEGTYGGKEEVTFGKVQKFDPEILSKEEGARVSGSYFSAGNLRESNTERFDEIRTLSDGQANPKTNSDFQKLLQHTRQDFSEMLSQLEPTILIGAGILEIIHGHRDPTDLMSTPYFTFEKGYFADYVTGNFPTIEDIQLVAENPQEPEEVFFTLYGERLTESQEEELKEDLLSQEFFKSSWNYAQPGTGSLVGPTTTDVTDDVIRLTSDALQLVPGVTQTVRFYDSDGAQVSGLDVETIYNAIQNAEPEFDMLKATRGSVESDFPIRRDGDSLSFLFDQVTLVLTPRGNSVDWQRPAEVSKLDTFTSAVNGMIESQLDLESHELEEPTEPQYHRLDEDSWVFDTNSLYHDHVGDEPSAILHTVMAHPFFEGTDVKIPWPVIFEFNKHADPGKGTNRTNRQGIENLAMLHSLERLGYLSVSIQDFPEQIDGGLNIGDIADIHILAYAQEVGGTLITGDHTLEELSNLVETRAINVADLKTYSAPFEGSLPEEEILPLIGSELNTRSTIVEEIEKILNTDSILPPVEGSQASPFDPGSIVDKWVSQEHIIPYYSPTEDEVCYAQRTDLSIVPTMDAVPQLVSHVDNDTNLLNGQYKQLLEFEGSQDPIGSDEFPNVNLHVPIEYIAKEAKPDKSPSDFNTKLLELRRTKTIEYQAKSALGSGNSHLQNLIEESIDSGPRGGLLTVEDYIALNLAIELDDAKLLVGEDQSATWKFSRLFGVEAIRLGSGDN